MSSFGQPPEDLDYSLPLEPMRLNVIGEQQSALKDLLTELINTHQTKLTTDQRHDLRDVYRQILSNVCWFIFKTAPFTPYFTTKFEPRSTYPANFLGRVCRSDQRGNT